MSPRERARIAAEQLPDRLKAARSLAGLTQDEVVAKADISSVTLSKLETGVNRPNFEILIALAYALDASPNFLAGWDAQPIPSQPSDRRRLLIRLNAVANQLHDEWIEQLISIAEKAAASAGR